MSKMWALNCPFNVYVEHVYAENDALFAVIIYKGVFRISNRMIQF